MFKKTLIASALTVATLGANAATVAITGTNVSLEGSAGAASIAVPNAVVTLGAEYAVNDTVTFTVSGAEFDQALSTPALAYADVSGGSGAGTLTLGLLNSSATTLTYRITEINPSTGDGVTTGDTLTLSGMVLSTATVLDAVGDISVAYSALTNNNQVLDSAGTNTDVSNTVVAQFSATTTKELNGVIDVDFDRQQFTMGDDTTTTDVLTVTPVEAVAAVNDAAYTGATVVISTDGDFSWMETDGDAGIDAAELAAAFAVTAGASDDTYTATINAAGDEITVVATDGGLNDVEAIVMTFTVAGAGAGNATLPVQSYTVDTTLNYNTAVPAAATKVVQTDASAGEWTLNGSQVNVSYMPYRSGISQVINVTNLSATQSGIISVTAYGEDGSVIELGDIATVAPNSIVRIAGAILDAFETATGVDHRTVATTTRYALEIVTSAPAANVEVYSAYNVGGTGARLVVNTSNGAE